MQNHFQNQVNDRRGVPNDAMVNVAWWNGWMVAKQVPLKWLRVDQSDWNLCSKVPLWGLDCEGLSRNSAVIMIPRAQTGSMLEPVGSYDFLSDSRNLEQKVPVDC